MEWQDEGIVLAARRHGERDALLSLLTFEHGRHRGLVRGGTGRRQRPLLQPGNRLACRWRARLPEQLGSWHLEPMRLYAAALMDDPPGLAAVGAACGLVELGLAEREPHPRLYAALLALMDHLAAGHPDRLARYVRFELLLLEELGFGLDLGACAVTGAREDLAYVSPKSGRAVARTAAGRWAPRLLPLPRFLTAEGAEDEGEVEAHELLAGLRLTGFFLERHVLAPQERPQPLARQRLLRLLGAQADGAATCGDGG